MLRYPVIRNFSNEKADYVHNQYDKSKDSVLQELIHIKKATQLKWKDNLKSIIYFTFSLLPLFFAYSFLFDGNPAISPWLGLIPLIIALIFITSGLACYFNVTQFNLSANRIVSSTKPIPIGGKIDVPIQEINCFKAVHYRSSSRSGGNFYLSIEYKNGRLKRIPNFPLSKAKAEQVSNILNSKYLKNDETH